MAHKTFDFLNESFLFSDMFRGNRYSSYTDFELKEELKRYREYVLSNLDSLHQEMTESASRLKVFATRDYYSIQQLMQSALYFDQVVSTDPLFQLTSEPSNLSNMMSQLLEMPNSEVVNRRELVETVGKMKTLAPMVEFGYLKFFPVSYYFEPDEETPLTYSESGYANALPPTILSKYHDKVVVKSIRKSKKFLTLEDFLHIGRDIAVQFEGDRIENTRFYSLVQNEDVEVDNESGTIRLKMILTDEPPQIEMFQTWVDQSINQAALGHYTRLIDEFALAAKFKASYLTGSEFTNSLLGTCVPNQSIEHFTANCILKFNLPFLENIEIQDLMNVRNNDGEAFQMFRAELERNLRELRLEPDPEFRQVKAENAMHELSVVNVASIEQKVASLQKKALSNVIVGLGGFVSTVVTSDITIAAIISAFVNRYNSYAENKAQIRENPAFFLWKVKSRK